MKASQAMVAIPRTMKAAQILKPNTDIQIVEVPVPVPTEEEVLIRVEACGICHTDLVVQTGQGFDINYPRIPGHEVIGRIVKMGNRVPKFLKENLLVGVGWHDQHCFTCTTCRRGDFALCTGDGKITGTGITRDGGYAQYVTARWEAVAVIPKEWSGNIPEAAPLLCAGLTVFNGFRHAQISPGEVVVVQGVGGLGHLAIQFAARLGYYTIALTSNESKQAEAKELGAKEALAIQDDDSHLTRIKELGGARVIIATAPSGKIISKLMNALGPNGTLLLVGVPSDPIVVDAMQLIPGRCKIFGWSAGHPTDVEDTLKVSWLSGVKPVVQTYPLEKVNEAFVAMKENKVRFRAVLLPNA